MDAQKLVKTGLFTWGSVAVLAMGLIFSSCIHGAEGYRYQDVRQIVLAGHFKRVNVNVGSASSVFVESTTKQDRLSFQQSGDMLSIKTLDNRGDSNTAKSQVITGNINSVAIGENASSVVSIGGVGDRSSTSQTLAEISIAVPKGTGISLEGSMVNAKIGDTLGDLSLNLGGVSNIEVGSVGDVYADLAGATSAHIAKITGNLSVEIAGSGELSVASGEIRQLNISTTGVGNVEVNAVADKAMIAVTGAGTVRVKQVKTKPEVSILGTGDVKIGGY